MKIIEKIDDLKQKMQTNPAEYTALGDKMQKYSCLAIEQGRKGWAWHEYMRIFASNDDQLKRLLGEDDAFNGTVWGSKSLAYIVAGGCCGINTPGGGPALTATMRNDLDAGDLDPNTEPNYA